MTPSTALHPSAAPSRPAPDVSVCIANWNCAALLRGCLRSLFEQDQGVTFEVVVADNGSTDGAAEMIAAEFPQVTLIRNGDNRGFAVASNQAAAVARGRFLFFLNNDTLVPPGAL
ncbi:MAG: glycosyltransferase, partial [Gemmataceae bacterium]|nr:glycosyltransferase [Gemmataceae bacterium]